MKSTTRIPLLVTMMALAATTMLVNVLVSVGQFQRDLQNELTREGLAAAWAGGSTSGRRPRHAQLGITDQIRQAYRGGASIAALAREHDVSRRDPHRGRRPATQPARPARTRRRGGTGIAGGDSRQGRQLPRPPPPLRPHRFRKCDSAGSCARHFACQCAKLLQS